MTQGANGRSTGEQGSSDSDEELMGRLAAGRPDVLSLLHGRYAPLIFGFASRSLGHSAAEEIVQDVFVAIWRKADTFDPARGTFRSWVLRIAELRVLNEIRRRGRQPKFDPDPDGLHLGNVSERGPGPDEAAWLEYRRAIVRAAVEALPPPHRQALSMAFLEDLTHQQIADCLNLPLGTAKTRIRAGLQTLRARLAPLAVGLLIAALLATAFSRDWMLTANLRRDEAALRLVTSSDIVPRRLTAAPGTPAETHGNYRGRPGVAMAVLTFSRFRPAPAGHSYHAWGMFGGRWYLLGTVRPDAEGSDILVTEGPHLATQPTAVKVTLEPVGSPIGPTGAPVVVWPAP